MDNIISCVFSMEIKQENMKKNLVSNDNWLVMKGINGGMVMNAPKKNRKKN
jgi:hypothetical protein